MAENKFAKYAPAQPGGNKFAKYPAQPAPQPDVQGANPDASLPDHATQVQSEYDNLPWYQKPLKAADDMARLAANGVTFGYADKLAGLLNWTGTEAERQKSSDAMTRAGSAGVAAEIGGSMLPMSKAAQVGITASRIPGLVGKALGPIIDGAGYGALNATGNDQNIATGAAIGAAGGALGKIVGPIASKLLAKAQQTLSSPQIKDAARAAYQKADGLGVVYAPEAVTGLTNDLKDQFAKFGYHPELQPGAKVALGELDRLAQNGNVNLTGLDTARKLASNAYIPGNKSNNALVSKVISGIDDMAANVGPANVVTGNAPEAAATLADARSLWGKSAKMDTVDFLKQKAENRAASTGSGGNVENATRQNLRQLLDNPAKARGFTPDELAQVKTVVGGTATQNILRQLGKFSPFGNGLTGAIEGTGALTAQMAGSPMVAALPLGAAAVGTASKYASEAIQRKSLETLTKMLATGKSASELAPSLSENQIKAIDMIKRALMAGGSAAAIEAQR